MQEADSPNPSILVLIAAVNEEAGIGPTIKDIKKYLRNPHILVVDGYSKDKTAEIATKLGAQVIYRNRNGKGDALAHAIANVTDDYDYAVLVDADYTYPAEFIPKMLEIISEEASVGMVCGNRFNASFKTIWKNEMFYRGNKILGYTHNLLNGVEMRDPLSGLRVLRWHILKNWKPRSKGFDIEVEMNHHVERQGFGISEIDIPYRQRLGEKKLRARNGLQILRRMIVEAGMGARD